MFKNICENRCCAENTWLEMSKSPISLQMSAPFLACIVMALGGWEEVT